MMKIKGNTRGMVYASAIAAIYVVLTLVSAAVGLSGGVIQFRLSEALTVLPVFTGAAFHVLHQVGIGIDFFNMGHAADTESVHQVSIIPFHLISPYRLLIIIA